MLARLVDPAIEQCERTIALDAANPWAYFLLGWAYEQKGMYGEAVREHGKAVERSGRSTVMVGALGYALAVSGDRAGAQKTLEELSEKSKHKYVASYEIGMIHAGLNDADVAFRWFDNAVEERSGWLVYLRLEPRLDSLRRDPRYEDLLQRVGVP